MAVRRRASIPALLALLLLTDAVRIARPVVSRRAALGGAGLAAGGLLAAAPPATLPAAAGVPALAFPGGGNFFWWQAGAAAWLQSRFELADAQFVGGSAGAMSAVLVACGVDFGAAFELGERLRGGASEAELNKKPPYRAGYIRQWLDGVLPADARDRCDGRVHISVTELAPSFGTTSVSTFADRADLIDAVLASVHVPLWMDPRFCTTFRGAQCIDGSLYLPRLSEPALLSRPPYTLPDGSPADVRVFQFDDPRMQAAYPSPGDFLASTSAAEKRTMMAWGASHLAQLDERGELSALAALRRPSPTEVLIADRAAIAEPGVD